MIKAAKKSSKNSPKKSQKKIPQKGSLRMVKAAHALVGNGGNKAAALREAGYSAAVVDNPKKVTESKTFQDILAQIIPPDFIVTEHKSLFTQQKMESFIIAGFPSDEDIAEMKESLKSVGCRFQSIRQTKNGTFCFYYAPDLSAKARAIEMAYKLHGAFPNDKGPGVVVPVQVNINNDRDAYSQ